MIVIDGRKEENLHYKWSPNLRPIANVRSGDEIYVIVPDSSTWQIKPDFTTEDLGKIDGSKFDAAVGPIFVDGAEPGDALMVEIEDIEVSDWGWSAILGFIGLLKGRFRDRLVIWSISNGYATTRGDFLKGIKVPIRPFLGVIGTAPREGEFGMIPPQYFGGNMDNKLHGEGARVYLPVNVKGALLSIADPHASQGDGEVTGTAIETQANVRLRVEVVKGLNIRRPFTIAPTYEEGEVIAAMGISNDLYEAARQAIEDMLALLGRFYGLSPEEGYVLSSVVGNLRISEIVDEPNFVVTLSIPKRVLPQ